MCKCEREIFFALKEVDYMVVAPPNAPARSSSVLAKAFRPGPRQKAACVREVLDYQR